MPAKGEKSNFWNGGKRSVICEYCGKEDYKTLTEITVSKHHYCNRQCYMNARYQYYSPDNGYVRSCLFCGKGFVKGCESNHIFSNRMYCGLKCSRRICTTIVGQQKKGETIECEVCHKMFYMPACRIASGRKFCSQKCRLTIFALNGSKIFKRLKTNPEWIKKMSERMKNGGGRKARLSQKCYKPNRPEMRFMCALLVNGVKDFIFQFPYELGLADFFIFPNIIVECDGVYWHSREESKKREPLQMEWLKSNGYQVFRFSEYEIKENVDACVLKLLSNENEK